MRKSGFTLIELIAVLVILGILAATAAPKFIDLKRDAKISVLEGIKSAIVSSTKLVQAKAIALGRYNSPCTMICIGTKCDNGPYYECSDGGYGSISTEDDYILWRNGGLHHNSALASLRKMFITDESLLIESCGPSGNICVMFEGDTTSCCNFVVGPFPRNSNACMIHLWLASGESTNPQIIEILDGAC